jgi:hypothetical protein
MMSAVLSEVGDHKVFPIAPKTDHFVMSQKTLVSINVPSQNQNKNICSLLLGCEERIRVGCAFFVDFFFLNDAYSPVVACQVGK